MYDEQQADQRGYESDIGYLSTLPEARGLSSIDTLLQSTRDRKRDREDVQVSKAKQCQTNVEYYKDARIKLQAVKAAASQGWQRHLSISIRPGTARAPSVTEDSTTTYLSANPSHHKMAMR